MAVRDSWTGARKNRPGRGGSYLPPLPQIRTCPIKASGSSRQGFTFPLRYPWAFREPGTGVRSPRQVSRPRLPDEQPPSLPRVPAVQVPLRHRYYEAVRLPGPLSPRFLVVRLAIPCGAPVGSLPAAQNARPRAWGSSPGPHYRECPHGGRSGPPRFLDNPRAATPCSSTPAGPDAPCRDGVPMLPPCCQKRRLHAGSTLGAQ